eukprot:SM000519S17847  [mRNA]  locus=s519:401:878:+ [translate_table: standard]
MLYTACDPYYACDNLGVDYDASCTDALCRLSTSAITRCELVYKADGTSCRAASGGYTAQCANLTCQSVLSSPRA